MDTKIWSVDCIIVINKECKYKPSMSINKNGLFALVSVVCLYLLVAGGAVNYKENDSAIDRFKLN